MHRMHGAAFDGAAGRDQALAEHLAAEDALSAEVGGLAAEEVHFELFEIELRDQGLERRIHQGMSSSFPVVLRSARSSCAFAACSSGRASSSRSLRSPRSIAPSTAPARVSNSSRVIT